jgi:septum formation protein
MSPLDEGKSHPKPHLPPLILASASPRRVQLLRQIGLAFAVVPAEVAEGAPEFLTPGEMAKMNARRKALEVARTHPQALVLGADTLVCLENQVFGKPASLTEAHQMLSQLAGRTHQVVTGVCLVQRARRQERLFAVATKVTFRALSSAQIQHYLTMINPLDKAGAYAIQEHGDLIVERTEGSLTNVIGLPLERLREELQIWASPPESV